ncbi:unnamed protein product [Calicophoron daubneyi]|uniref:Fibronectin type-III domain-containing protein n=1 Tax=Calicophoron daubneyi TaxID=300641 RepID=A0AAV2SZ68_CALDB
MADVFASLGLLSLSVGGGDLRARLAIDKIRVSAVTTLLPCPIPGSRGLQWLTIFYYTQIDLDISEQDPIFDPNVHTHELSNLNLDTKYTVCLRISRKRHEKASLIKQGQSSTEAVAASSLRRVYRNSDLTSLGAGKRALLNHTDRPKFDHAHGAYVAEMRCVDIVTKQFHWSAFISSLVGIFIAILIALCVFIVLKRWQVRAVNSKRDQRQPQCPCFSYVRCDERPLTERNIAMTCVTSSSFPRSDKHSGPHHHHQHHHHDHQHQRHQHSSHHHFRDLTPLVTTTASKQEPKSQKGSAQKQAESANGKFQGKEQPPKTRAELGEKKPQQTQLRQLVVSREDAAANPDLLSVDAIYSMSGSDSFQMSSTSSVTDPAAEDGRSLSNQIGVSKDNREPQNASRNESGLGFNKPMTQKRTVSFLDSDKPKTQNVNQRVKGLCKSLRLGNKGEINKATEDMVTSAAQTKNNDSTNSPRKSQQGASLPRPVPANLPEVPKTSVNKTQEEISKLTGKIESRLVSERNSISIPESGRSSENANSAPASGGHTPQTLAESSYPVGLQSPKLGEVDSVMITTEHSSGNEVNKDPEAKPDFVSCSPSPAGFRLFDLDNSSLLNDNESLGSLITSQTYCCVAEQSVNNLPNTTPNSEIKDVDSIPLFGNSHLPVTSQSEDSSMFFTQVIETL